MQMFHAMYMYYVVINRERKFDAVDCMMWHTYLWMCDIIFMDFILVLSVIFCRYMFHRARFSRHVSAAAMTLVLHHWFIGYVIESVDG